MYTEGIKFIKANLEVLDEDEFKEYWWVILNLIMVRHDKKGTEFPEYNDFLTELYNFSVIISTKLNDEWLYPNKEDSEEIYSDFALTGVSIFNDLMMNANVVKDIQNLLDKKFKNLVNISGEERWKHLYVLILLTGEVLKMYTQSRNKIHKNIPYIMHNLKSENERIRYAGIVTLGTCALNLNIDDFHNTYGSQCLPILLELISKEKYPTIQIQIFNTLGDLLGNLKAKDSLPFVSDIIKIIMDNIKTSEDYNVKKAAISCMGDLSLGLENEFEPYFESSFSFLHSLYLNSLSQSELSFRSSIYSTLGGLIVKKKSSKAKEYAEIIFTDLLSQVREDIKYRVWKHVLIRTMADLVRTIPQVFIDNIEEIMGWLLKEISINPCLCAGSSNLLTLKNNEESVADSAVHLLGNLAKELPTLLFHPFIQKVLDLTFNFALQDFDASILDEMCRTAVRFIKCLQSAGDPQLLEFVKSQLTRPLLNNEETYLQIFIGLTHKIIKIVNMDTAGIEDLYMFYWKDYFMNLIDDKKETFQRETSMAMSDVIEELLSKLKEKPEEYQKKGVNMVLDFLKEQSKLILSKKTSKSLCSEGEEGEDNPQITLINFSNLLLAAIVNKCPWNIWKDELEFMIKAITSTKFNEPNLCFCRQTACFNLGEICKLIPVDMFTEEVSKNICEYIEESYKMDMSNGYKEQMNAFDNEVAALGKMIIYQGVHTSEQKGNLISGEIIDIYIQGLPIREDTEEALAHNMDLANFLKGEEREYLLKNCDVKLRVGTIIEKLEVIKGMGEKFLSGEVVITIQGVIQELTLYMHDI